MRYRQFETRLAWHWEHHDDRTTIAATAYGERTLGIIVEVRQQSFDERFESIAFRKQLVSVAVLTAVLVTASPSWAASLLAEYLHIKAKLARVVLGCLR